MDRGGPFEFEAKTWAGAIRRQPAGPRSRQRSDDSGHSPQRIGIRCEITSLNSEFCPAAFQNNCTPGETDFIAAAELPGADYRRTERKDEMSTTAESLAKAEERRAVALALIAGYLDAFGYLTLGTYVSFMSGNTTYEISPGWQRNQAPMAIAPLSPDTNWTMERRVSFNLRGGT